MIGWVLCKIFGHPKRHHVDVWVGDQMVARGCLRCKYYDEVCA